MEVRSRIHQIKIFLLVLGVRYIQGRHEVEGKDGMSVFPFVCKLALVVLSELL